MLTEEHESFLNHHLIHFTAQCWEWIGCLKQSSGSNAGGYSLGYCPDIKKHGPFHRYAYRLWNGPIAEGLQIDHLCRNRACVNPSHLEAVTPSENQHRAAVLITHCPKGHEYTPENTRTKAGGSKRTPTRVCRECSRVYGRGQYAQDPQKSRDKQKAYRLRHLEEVNGRRRAAYHIKKNSDLTL